MKFNRIVHKGVEIRESAIESGRRRILHAVVSPENDGEGIGGAIECVKRTIAEYEERGLVAVCVRIEASDPSTQSVIIREILKEEAERCAISIVGQAPQPLRKITALLVLESDARVERIDANTIRATSETDETAEREYWTTHIASAEGDSYKETQGQLERYEEMLRANGMTIADNCLRTWFFVRDIDRNYGGVVEGRKENFLLNGLTEETHYIASTGIEGRDAETGVTSILDAFAIGGAEAGQTHILYASENMNKTIEYGVTFERGAMFDYRDGIRQVFVSGTASIDTKGEVMHKGDVGMQTERMAENVEAVLKEAECGWEDVAYAVVYLRDAADYERAKGILEKRFGECPYMIVLASVCRPEWLIEMECVAMKKMG